MDWWLEQVKAAGSDKHSEIVNNLNTGLGQVITHKIGITGLKDVDDHVLAWPRQAYCLTV